MDVHFRDHRHYNDGCACLCGPSDMANQGFLPLFAAGIDACKSLCVASCAQSAIDVFLVLDLGFLIHGSVWSLHGEALCIFGYRCIE